jgi:quinol monooxygenase YgiN
MLKMYKIRVTSRENGGAMELFIFARFHAREGHEAAVAAALREVVAPSGEEQGCLGIQAYRSIRDPRLFYVHSRWTDETAFELHAELPHTVQFVQRVQTLIDHPLDVTRARPLG